FQTAIHTRNFSVGGFKLGQVTGLSIVHFAEPILGKSGEVLRVAIAAVPLAQLDSEDISEQSVLRGYTLAKVDSRGVVLAHRSPTGEWITGNASPPLRFSSALFAGGPRTIVSTGANGQPFLYAASPVMTRTGSNSIYLILGVPEA